MLKTSYEPQNILVVMHRALGDSVFGLAALRYLRTVFPKAKVTYALPRWITPLYLELDCDADRVLPMELSSISGVWDFVSEIRREKYDLVFELQQSGRTRKILKAASLALNFRYIFHNHHLKQGQFIFEQGIRKAITQRHLDTIYSYIKSLNSEAAYPNYLEFAPLLKTKNKLEKKKQIVLGLVASKEEKKWPVESFAALAKSLRTTHPDLSFLVPISSSEEDRKLAEKFLLSFNDSCVEVVQLSLSELALKISQASFYLGNDTGLKHIAAAFGLKTITFFGPEEPLEWHPYDLRRHLFFWAHGFDARTKMGLPCLLKQFDNSKKLEEISVEEVSRVLKDADFFSSDAIAP